MYGYMWLGAWLLTLLFLGIVAITTGLPNERYHEESQIVSAWLAKCLYLFALAMTFYHMGVHFGDM